VTLRRYLQVLRQQKWTIVVVVVVAVGGALAYSLTRSPSYSAHASLAFRDESEDLGLLGTPTTPVLQPEKFAAAQERLITQPAVVTRVKRTLKSRKSPAELRDSLSTTIEPTSGLVLVKTHAGTAREAAALANAFAHQTQVVVTRAQRARYAAAARQLRAGFRRVGTRVRDAPERAIYVDRITRLMSLATFARPVTIQGSAEVPRSPTSPRPVRDGLLAGMLGLILGTLLAFTRESLDRRLRTSQDVTEQLESPLLGHVREEALGRPVASGGQGLLAEADLEAVRSSTSIASCAPSS